MKAKARVVVGLLAAALLGALILGVTLASAIAPVVTIENASSLSYNAAHVKGSVDRSEQVTTYRFQYITDALFEENIANTLPGFEGAATGPEATLEEGGPGPQSVEGDLGGLNPGTTYHLRLVAENADGQSEAIAATFETDAVAKPEAKEVEVSAVTTNSAHLKGVVNAGGSGAGEEAGTYRFECEPECPGLEGDQPIPGAGSDVEVSDDASGLQPNTAYTVKLIVRNAQTDAEGQAVVAEAAGPFTTGAVAPEVTTPPLAAPTQTSMTLRAFVNPRNSEITDCHFDFGTDTSYGQTFPCQGDPGAGNEPVLVSAEVSGLQAATEYHYRLIAHNQSGDGSSGDIEIETLAAPPEEACPNEAIRIAQHSTELADCRAYELVSPPDKNGGDVMGESSRTRAAADGSAVQFSSLIGFGDIQGTGIAADYLATRTPGAGSNGWTTHGITSPQKPFTGSDFSVEGFESRYLGEFSSDLGKGVFLAATPLTVAPNLLETVKLYLRDDLRSGPPGHYSLITDCPGCLAPFPPQIASKSAYKAQPGFAGASADFNHVLFESPLSLTTDAPACANPYAASCGPKLYEWVSGSGGGTVSLVGQIPSSGAECVEAQCTPSETSAAGQGAGRTNVISPHYTLNTISTDGSRIVFSTNMTSGSTPTETSNLYMRVDGTKTLQLNASEKAEPDEPGAAMFQAATPDGSKVFFTSSEQLTDTAAGGLYRYDVNASSNHHLSSLVTDKQPNDGGAGFDGVVGVSDDGSYVYFVASGGQLAAKGPTGDGSRIYLWHEGDIHEVGKIGNWDVNAVSATLALEGWKIRQKTARVTPDGKHMVFVSGATDELVGAERGNCHFGEGAPSCAEVYVYDATANGGAGALACASCDPAGASALADATFTTVINTSLAQPTQHLNHPLSDDGRYVFFSTSTSLVDNDTNGSTDVYEYDTVSGEIHLLSSGTNASGSYFLDAAASGNDAFFITREELNGWDPEGNYDLYDARVGGGVPEPAPQDANCTGEACRPSHGSPAVSRAGSSTLSSGGNTKLHHRRKRAHKRAHKKRNRHHVLRANRHFGGVR